MDNEKLQDLKHFVELCKTNPLILQNPSLSFFKSFLESLGARVPSSVKSEQGGEEHLDELDEDIIESDVELDNTDTVEPDNDPPQQMGDSSSEVTDESRDAAQISKAKALDAISEGKLNEAIDHLTEAILLNPNSAILYATRANVFIKLKKPNAAIRDADAALKVNPDSAKGYKVRGMARAMLGLWKEAASDLRVASMIDFDEEIAEILKKVEPNAHKIEEHCVKYQRLREGKSRKIKRDRQWCQAEAKAAYEKSRAKEQQSEHEASDPDSASDLNDGKVVGNHSVSELETKLSAASRASRLAILYFTATSMGELLVDKHVKYIITVEKRKDDFESVVMEHLRLNGAYWGLTTLAIMGKLAAVDQDEVISWVMQCQHESGGFGGNIGHDPHVLYTLSAIQVLALFDKLHVLDIDKLDIAGLQNEDGSFSGDLWGEVDTRFSYIAILSLALLHQLDKIDVGKAVKYILSCKNVDGGFGCTPGAESHAGQIFCCVAALAITGSLHHVDKDLLGWWLCERQVKSGGLNGRPEKLPDVCYSWWVLSSLIMIDRVHWIDKGKLVKFILDCQDKENGGISDRPDDAVDVFHTYFGVAGLSLLEYPGIKPIDPAYALPVDVVNRVMLGR